MKTILLLVLAYLTAMLPGKLVVTYEEGFTFGSSMTTVPVQSSAPLNQLNRDSVRALKKNDCPCKCITRAKAKSQCKPFRGFCDVSGCEFTNRKKGAQCCRKGEESIGSCDCRSKFGSVAISFDSEDGAKNAAADLCVDPQEGQDVSSEL